jgi:S-DNA-T family DNA segregation ATPase FtsK/SpoIIIE
MQIMKQAKHVKTSESFFIHYIKHYLVEGIFIGIAAIAVFLLLALLTYQQTDAAWSSSGNLMPIKNAMGKTGAWLADVLLYLFGYIAYLIPLCCVYTCLIVFHQRYEAEYSLLTVRGLGFLLILISACSLFSLNIDASADYLPYSSGGILGSNLGLALFEAFNNLGSGLLLVTVLLAGITLATGLSWFRVIDRIGHYSIVCGAWWWNKILIWIKSNCKPAETKSAYEKIIKASEKETIAEAIIKPFRATSKMPLIADLPKNIIKLSPRAEQEKQSNLFENHEFGGLPPLYLLNKPAPRNESLAYSKEALANLSRLVEEKLAEFNIDTNVVAVYPGPVITRFE